MKLILSRKGFDSDNGGMPSPILRDGTMLSFPIPSEGDGIRFGELSYKGEAYSQIFRQLNPNCKVSGADECHLDPDMRGDAISRSAGWKPAFGQIGAAQSHLRNQGVGVGDIFLFFGWFREAALTRRGYEYVGANQGFHAIYTILKLTKDGYSRSVWGLPDFFKRIPISYNLNAWRGDEFHSAAKGQEFVFEANEDATEWVKRVLTSQ